MKGQIHKTDCTWYTNTEFAGVTIPANTQVDWIEGDLTMAFNKANIDGEDEYDRLKNLFAAYPTIDIVHWFSGHYHVKGFNWQDTGLNADISVIPSAMPATDIYGVDFTDSVEINQISTASVTPQNNPGCITVVHVNAQNTDPDIYIYSQWDPNVPDPKMWDNPDIQLYQNPSGGPISWGLPISSMSLDPGTEYGVEVRLCNRGCTDANGVQVSFIWADWNVCPYDGSHNNIWYWDSSNWISGNVASIDLPPGAEGKVYFKWKTGNYESHFCLVVRINHPADPLPSCWNWNSDNPTPGTTNQAGQENTNVKGCKGGTTGKIHIPIENLWNRTLHPQIEIIQHVKPGEANWSFMEVYIPEELPPGTDAVVFTVYPPLDTHGESREFSINLRDKNGFLLGGVIMKVVSDAPPTLECVGTPGYTDDGVEPDSGVVNTPFTYKVKYTDEDNDPPASDPLVYIFKGGQPIVGSPFVTQPEDPNDTDCRGGIIYGYSTTLTEPDDYTYYFRARDRFGVEATGPATNLMSGPLVKILPEKINETMYKNSITRPVDISKIHYKFKFVDEKWIIKWTNEIMYGQKKTKYSIAVYLNETRYVTGVDFKRWGFPITEIPYNLAKQSLASLPPGFAIDP